VDAAAGPSAAIGLADEDPELTDRVDSELLLRTISYRHAHMRG